MSYLSKLSHPLPEIRNRCIDTLLFKYKNKMEEWGEGREEGYRGIVNLFNSDSSGSSSSGSGRLYKDVEIIILITQIIEESAYSLGKFISCNALPILLKYHQMLNEQNIVLIPLNTLLSILQTATKISAEIEMNEAIKKSMVETSNKNNDISISFNSTIPTIIFSPIHLSKSDATILYETGLRLGAENINNPKNHIINITDWIKWNLLENFPGEACINHISSGSINIYNSVELLSSITDKIIVSINNIKIPEINYPNIDYKSAFEYEYPQFKDTLKNDEFWNESLVLTEDKSPSNISLFNFSRMVFSLFTNLRTNPQFISILYPLFCKVIPLFFMSFNTNNLVSSSDIHRNFLRFEYLQTISDTISFFNFIPLSPVNSSPFTLIIDICLKLLEYGEIDSDKSLDLIPAPLMQQLEIVLLDYFFMKSRQDICERIVNIMKKLNPELILDFENSNHIINSWILSKLNCLNFNLEFNASDFDKIIQSLEYVIKGIENYPFNLDTLPNFLVSVTNSLSKVIQPEFLNRGVSFYSSLLNHSVLKIRILVYAELNRCVVDCVNNFNNCNTITPWIEGVLCRVVCSGNSDTSEEVVNYATSILSSIAYFFPTSLLPFISLINVFYLSNVKLLEIVSKLNPLCDESTQIEFELRKMFNINYKSVSNEKNILELVNKIWSSKISAMGIQSSQVNSQLQIMLNKRGTISDPFYSYPNWNVEVSKNAHSVTSNYANLLSIISVITSNSDFEVRTSSASQLLNYFPLASADLTYSLFSSDLLSSILSLLTSPQSLTWGVLGIEPICSISTNFSYEFLLINFQLFVFFLKSCIFKKLDFISFGDIRLPLPKLPCLLLPYVFSFDENIRGCYAAICEICLFLPKSFFPNHFESLDTTFGIENFGLVKDKLYIPLHLENWRFNYPIQEFSNLTLNPLSLRVQTLLKSYFSYTSCSTNESISYDVAQLIKVVISQLNDSKNHNEFRKSLNLLSSMIMSCFNGNINELQTLIKTSFFESNIWELIFNIVSRPPQNSDDIYLYKNCIEFIELGLKISKALNISWFIEMIEIWNYSLFGVLVESLKEIHVEINSLSDSNLNIDCSSIPIQNVVSYSKNGDKTYLSVSILKFVVQFDFNKCRCFNTNSELIKKFRWNFDSLLINISSFKDQPKLASGNTDLSSTLNLLFDFLNYSVYLHPSIEPVQIQGLKLINKVSVSFSFKNKKHNSKLYMDNIEKICNLLMTYRTPFSFNGYSIISNSLDYLKNLLVNDTENLLDVPNGTKLWLPWLLKDLQHRCLDIKVYSRAVLNLILLKLSSDDFSRIFEKIELAKLNYEYSHSTKIEDLLSICLNYNHYSLDCVKANMQIYYSILSRILKLPFNPAYISVYVKAVNTLKLNLTYILNENILSSDICEVFLTIESLLGLFYILIKFSRDIYAQNIKDLPNALEILIDIDIFSRMSRLFYILLLKFESDIKDIEFVINCFLALIISAFEWISNSKDNYNNIYMKDSYFRNLIIQCFYVSNFSSSIVLSLKLLYQIIQSDPKLMINTIAIDNKTPTCDVLTFKFTKRCSHILELSRKDDDRVLLSAICLVLMAIAPLLPFPAETFDLNGSINSICYELELLLIPSFKKNDSKFYLLCETYCVLLQYSPDAKYYFLLENNCLKLVYEFLLKRVKQLEKMILSEHAFNSPLMIKELKSGLDLIDSFLTNSYLLGYSFTSDILPHFKPDLFLQLWKLNLATSTLSSNLISCIYHYFQSISFYLNAELKTNVEPLSLQCLNSLVVSLVKFFRANPTSFYLPIFHAFTSNEILLTTFLKQGQIVNFLWSQIMDSNDGIRQNLLLIIIRNITFREFGCERIYRLFVPGPGLEELINLTNNSNSEDVAWTIIRNLCFNSNLKIALISNPKFLPTLFSKFSSSSSFFVQNLAASSISALVYNSQKAKAAIKSYGVTKIEKFVLYKELEDSEDACDPNQEQLVYNLKSILNAVKT